MLKLMKYEFRKQLWSKGIILFLAAILEITFIIGIVADKEDWQGIALGFLAVLSMGAVFFVGLECVDTFSKDLKTKCSYMLFLTPHTSFSIVGSKILAGGIQIIVTGFAFLGLFALDAAILVTKYNKWDKTLRFMKMFLDEALHMEINTKYVVIMVLSLLISWIFIIVLSFFSITLSSTFLANKKYKGFVSFVIFVFIGWAVSYIQSYMIRVSYPVYTEGDMWFSLLYIFILSVIAYIGTAWMLEKKVSL